MKRLKTGIPGMDDLLLGGLPMYRTILVAGSTGAGKSIFASHFIQQGVKQKENCVYVTFEVPKEHLVADNKEIGINFEKMEAAGRLRIIGGPLGTIRYYKKKTKANLLDLTQEISEVIKETQAKRVVIDSVNLFLMLFENDAERRDAMASLSSMLAGLECTSLLTCEVKEATNDISWYGFEEFVVDGVIRLQRIPFENMYERAVAVVKMRGIDHSHNTAAFQIKKDGLKVYPDQEPFHALKGKK